MNFEDGLSKFCIMLCCVWWNGNGNVKGVVGEEECFFFCGFEMFIFKKVLVNYVIICFYYLIGIIDFLKVLEWIF